MVVKVVVVVFSLKIESHSLGRDLNIHVSSRCNLYSPPKTTKPIAPFIHDNNLDLHSDSNAGGESESKAINCNENKHIELDLINDSWDERQ